jgi:hypothetical protein
MGFRRARYDGIQKTQWQHVMTAVAINLVRLDAVFTQTPRGKTRQSHFIVWPCILLGTVKGPYDHSAIESRLRQQSLEKPRALPCPPQIILIPYALRNVTLPYSFWRPIRK